MISNWFLTPFSLPKDTVAERRVHFRSLLGQAQQLAKVGRGLAPTTAKIIHGVFSCSEVYDDILMWSHYADHHKGVCIGVRPALLGRRIMPVEYVDRVPILDVWDYTRSASGIFARLAVAKSARWAHEREWRTIGRPGSQRFPGCVDRVVIGERATPETRCGVLDAIQAAGYPIDVLTAKLSDTRYALRIQPKE
ncbi:MAG: DUF2971 domain-containing protein [Pirellulales bacterium]